MRNILLGSVLIITVSFSGIAMKSEAKEKPEISHPIHKPIRPIKPIVPVVVNPGIVYQDNYYNTTVEDNCNKYIEIIDQQDQEIAALKREIEMLKREADKRLQENLKKEHDKEIEEFDNRRSIKTKNSFSITDIEK
jgi:hypothetical protein